MQLLLSTYALKFPFTGIGWYTYYLLKALQGNVSINPLPYPTVPDCTLVRTGQKKTFQLRLRKIIRSWPATYSCFNYYCDFLFKKHTKHLAEKKVIYHEPCYILRPYNGPKICTIHDLSHIYFPESHPRERVKFLLRYLPKSIKAADHVITGSDYTRQEIINYFNLSPKKISTVYHGVAKKFRAYPMTASHPVLSHYGLVGKAYLLSVGTLEPRKNLERLIQAFSLLPERLRKKHPLVLIGEQGWHIAQLKKLINKLRAKRELYFLGYVPASDLPFLYSGSYVFAYPSLYEGFGLPLLEALACGVPILSANTSSMPEVVGEAALFTDPTDVFALAERLQQIVEDNVLRKELKKRGPMQAAKFSWQSCAEQTVAIYQQVLACFS
jgi:glycosyltransferase involved in cell wall biosynthesis